MRGEVVGGWGRPGLSPQKPTPLYSGHGQGQGTSEWPGASWGQVVPVGDGPPWVHGLPSTFAGTSSAKPKLLSPGEGQFFWDRVVKVFSWLRGLSYISGELGDRNKSINIFLEFFINFWPSLKILEASFCPLHLKNLWKLHSTDIQTHNYYWYFRNFHICWLYFPSLARHHLLYSSNAFHFEERKKI